MLHNFAAFLYINLIILIFIILNPNYNNFLIFFILISFLITSFFLIYSFFENNFLNRSLFYANTEYRSLFTKNHHQIAFYSSILIFLSAHFLLYLKKKIFLIPLIFFSYLLFISESNGNIFGIIVSIILTLIIFFFIKLKLFKINKYFFIFLLFIIGFSFCYLSFDPEINLFIYKFTMENNNVFFRLDFINFFINKLSLVNILLGHGPGGYVTSELSANHFREAHNTFIDLTIYSGIIPILLLIFVYFKTLSKLIFNNLYILLALLLFLFFYSLTHNIVRYPFYWIFFLFILTVNFNKKTDAN